MTARTERGCGSVHYPCLEPRRNHVELAELIRYGSQVQRRALSQSALCPPKAFFFYVSALMYHTRSLFFSFDEACAFRCCCCARSCSPGLDISFHDGARCAFSSCTFGSISQPVWCCATLLVSDWLSTAGVSTRATLVPVVHIVADR